MYFRQTQFAFILQPTENKITSETHIGRRHADLRHPALDDGVGVGRSWDQWKERPGLADGGKLGSDLKGPPVVRERGVDGMSPSLVRKRGVDGMSPPVPAVVMPLLEPPGVDGWMGAGRA